MAASPSVWQATNQLKTDIMDINGARKSSALCLTVPKDCNNAEHGSLGIVHRRNRAR